MNNSKLNSTDNKEYLLSEVSNELSIDSPLVINLEKLTIHFIHFVILSPFLLIFPSSPLSLSMA